MLLLKSISGGQFYDVKRGLSIVSYVKHFLKIARLLTRLSRVYLDHLTSKKSNQIVFTRNLEELSEFQNIVVYLHYSENNILTLHEKKMFSSLKKSGFGLCLVLNADEPSAIDELRINEYLQEYVCSIIIRNNIGLDLGAYRDVAILLNEQRNWNQKRLVLMNNSVLWFPNRVAPYLSELIESESDIFASSISNQYQKHIQTFLFGFGTAVGAKQINEWLGTCKNWKLKQSVVSLGELSTNRFFTQRITVKAHPNFSQIVELSISKLAKITEFGITPKDATFSDRLKNNLIFLQAGVPQNNTHAYWLEIVELGFPGIKVDLMKNNSSRVPDHVEAIKCAIDNGISANEISALLISNRTSSRMIRARSKLRI